VVPVTIFSVYYAREIVGNQAGLGDLWWSRVVWVSMLAVVLTAPFLGYLADRRGLRKRLFMVFTALCIAALALFPTIERGMIVWGFLLAALANFAFESAQVYYNAYLPEIAPPERRGFVSGLGFGIGYAGSIIGLLVALVFVNRGTLDLVWLWVAAFFLVFSVPAFLTLPSVAPNPAPPVPIWRLARDVFGNPEVRRFLLAYFLYFDGVETVIYFSGIFAAGTLGFTLQENIKLFLAVQVAALVGALALARATDRWGPRRVISMVLIQWIAVVVAAFFVESKSAFFAVALFAGVGLGVVQAASRALMATLIPAGKEAEMFGFYAFCGKSSSILGPFVFGTVSHALGGNQRVAILTIGAFFLVGLILLQRVKTSSRSV
jgi:MFS transporter, UMF1 family